MGNKHVHPVPLRAGECSLVVENRMTRESRASPIFIALTYLHDMLHRELQDKNERFYSTDRYTRRNQIEDRKTRSKNDMLVVSTAAVP